MLLLQQDHVHSHSGEWTEKEDASKIEDAFRGTGPDDFIRAERVELEYLKNSFAPTAFGDLASTEIKKWKEADEFNERNLSECTKAQNCGKVPAGRYLVQVTPDPPRRRWHQPKAAIWLLCSRLNAHARVKG